MADQISTIPKGWKMTTLGEVAEIKTGKTNSQDADENGEYPLFDRSNIIKKSKKFLFNTEAIIVPGEGKEFNPRYYNGKFDLHQRVYAIFNFKNCIQKFIFYNILLNRFFFKSFAVGSTVSSLRLEHFLNFPIISPPLYEQKAIAEVLSSIDDKIELLREENKTLEATAQAIFKEWFVKFNFPNSEGKPYKASGGKMIDSELGEIPEGWRVGRLGDEVVTML